MSPRGRLTPAETKLLLFLLRLLNRRTREEALISVLLLALLQVLQ